MISPWCNWKVDGICEGHEDQVMSSAAVQEICCVFLLTRDKEPVSDSAREDVDRVKMSL